MLCTAFCPLSQHSYGIVIVGGKFHISHDASLHTILSSFRTHVISVRKGRDSWPTLESDVFRRRELLYLCCVDLFTIFVFLFQIYLLLSQRECFARRYWLTCRPITRQSTQMLREASEQDLCFSTSCYEALHGFTSDFNLLVVKWISVVRVRFLICCLFVIAVLIVSSIIHRYSEYINRTVTVHAITSTSSAYVVENTKIITDEKDVYRR